MKKKVMISVAVILLCILYGVGVCTTYNKYRLPDVQYVGLNEAVECNGTSLVMKDMKAYTLDEICAEYGFTPEEINLTTDCEKIYYVANFEIERVSEDGDMMSLVDVGKYNKYSSGNYTEGIIEMFINGGYIFNRTLEVGEKTEYMFVKSLVDYQFSEDTFKELDEDDLWIRIYDYENDCEYYFGVDL